MKKVRKIPFYHISSCFQCSVEPLNEPAASWEGMGISGRGSPLALLAAVWKQCASFCQTFDGSPSLPHGCHLFGHRPAKVNHLLPPALPPQSHFPHRHTHAHQTPPSSQTAESTLVQEGCSCLCGPASVAWLVCVCVCVRVRLGACIYTTEC